MLDMQRLSIETLYGKLGAAIVSPESKSLAIESLTGAIKACYPAPPRQAVLDIATKVVAQIGKDVVMESPSFGLVKSCPNAGKGGKVFWGHDMPKFKGAFKTAWQELLSNNENARKAFETSAKDCQGDCLTKAIAKAAFTLYESDRQPHLDSDMYIESFTGAVKMCYPGVERSLAKELVSDVFITLLSGATDMSSYE